MIGLRIVHVLANLRVSASASEAINIMRWLKAHDHESLLLSGPGERERDVEEEGFELRRYAQRGAGWWFGGRRRLVQDIENWKPDLIHIHNLDCVGVFLSVAVKLELPVIVGISRIPSDKELELLRDPQVSLIIAASESIRAQLVSKLGFDRDMVTVVPHGLDLQRYPFTKAPVALNTVGAIGRFEPRFGFDVLLQALSLLNDKDIRLQATLVGNGDGAGQLMQMVESLHLIQQVSIIPGASRTSSILSQLDLFVYPGKEDLLTLGVLKSMACGRPVVATAVGSMTEWVHEGIDGLLVPANAPQALADALEELWKTPERLTTMGEAARKGIQKRHDLAIVGEAIHECYRSCLKSDTSKIGTEVVTAYRRLTSMNAGDSSAEGL